MANLFLPLSKPELDSGFYIGSWIDGEVEDDGSDGNIVPVQAP